MNDRDCESCKKFSRVDPIESEGYCDAKRTWVDPQEGEDCKMHEFTLHSANKYKDGTPIMSEPKSNQLDPKYCSLGRCPYYDKFCDHTLKDKYGCRYLPHNTGANLEYLEQTFTEFAKTQDDLIAEYDETLKTHGDTLEEHLERICDLEHMYENVLDDICAMRERLCKISERLCKITDLLVGQNNHAHIFSNFCGNCIHAEMKDGICACELSGEIVDPDSASCSLFDPSYASNPEWFENMKKTMTTPAEPTTGCKDCNCAKDGMCTKYNCSLGAICATPECFEPPF